MSSVKCGLSQGDHSSEQPSTERCTSPTTAHACLQQPLTISTDWQKDRRYRDIASCFNQSSAA